MHYLQEKIEELFSKLSNPGMETEKFDEYLKSVNKKTINKDEWDFTLIEYLTKGI